MTNFLIGVVVGWMAGTVITAMLMQGGDGR